MKEGKFISLEGSEGAGKSTAISVITTTLEQWGVDFITTREPGGEANAEKIREILLHADHLDARTELLLMFASRNEHLVKTIRPALKQGIWVVSDRFVDASYAYQGGGRGIENEVIAYLEKFTVKDTQADLTLYLDVDPAEGLSRIAGRSVKDRIEQEHLSFFNKIRSAYLQRMEQNPQRIKRVDSNQNIQQVQAQIKLILKEFKKTL